MTVVHERHDRPSAGWTRLIDVPADGEDPADNVLSLGSAPDAIELRHLRSFVAVAEELNFGRAATRLYVSQPALSRQIRALERLVGCDLLRRSTHRVELTLAGEALLERSRGLLRQVDDAVTATRSVGGELDARLARLWEPITELASTSFDYERLREAYETLHAQFEPPPEINVRPVNAGGVPSLLLTTANDQPATLLYFHGGGFVLGSAYGYRAIAGALAVAAGAGAVVPDYRLAPEHPFPAAIEDAQRAYSWMLDRGVAADDVVVAGDSVGASIALSLMITLQQQREPFPGAAILLCPGVELGGMGRLRAPHEPQPLMPSEEAVRRIAADYLAGHSGDDPLVSPLRADLSGFPPMLVQAATGDERLDDAERLVERARDHGVAVTYELYAVATHVFQLFWSFLPEASDAMEHAGRFARRAVGRSAAPKDVTAR